MLLLYGGHTLFSVGFLGLFLPVLPTTVFWIGAAMCYAKCSPERFEKLLNRSDKGRVLAEYLEHGVIAQSAKRVAVAGMLLSMAVLLWLPIGLTAQLLGIAGILVGMLYVLTRRSERTPASSKS